MNSSGNFSCFFLLEALLLPPVTPTTVQVEASTHHSILAAKRSTHPCPAPPAPSRTRATSRSSAVAVSPILACPAPTRQYVLPGEVSCAECRRLKIKCDKQIPCQSCVRRGCVALCPNGALATGQGTRFVLAATEHLHRKIARMGARIRRLEDALGALHAAQGGVDAAVHQLLADSEDYSVPEERDPAARRGAGTWEALEDGAEGKAPGGGGGGGGDVIDAFGTLSISDHGISRFFGPTGGCESLSPPSTHASARTDSPAAPSTNYSYPAAASLSLHGHGHSPEHAASPAVLFSTSAFPLTPLGPPHAIHALVTSHLPPRARARRLVDGYFAQLAWLFRGVTRGQARDMLRGVYGAYGRPDDADAGFDGACADADADAPGAAGDEWGEEEEEEEDYTGPHDLALLFMVFAVGALVQPQPQPQPRDDSAGEAHRRQIGAEAEHLHQIARAALALQPVLEKPSLVTIQALHLLSIYTALAGGASGAGGAGDGDGDSEASMEMTWSLVTLAAHLSQTIGLHRDSARWGLSATMVQRRRILFWDLFVADVWQSLNTGRPPSFSLAYIDCSLPTYEGVKAKDAIFEVWQFRFAAECVADVTARTLTAEAPSYTTITELDKKVREFPLPPLDDAAPDDVGASLQRCVLEHIRETVLMYIHRSFFAQAIIEQPVNPLKSIYAPSFLAAYRSSATILKSVREQFAVMPNACARFWTMWTFAFSAAVVFGTVVTRGPRSPLAGAAMAELEQACVLFSKAALYSRRATKALPILTKLREKARHALAAAQSDPSGGDKSGLLWSMTGVLGPTGQPVRVKKEEPDDELSIFAGHTRFVSGQIQRGAQSPVQSPSPRQQLRDHQQQQQQQRVPRQIRTDEEMQYGSYNARHYPRVYPGEPQQHPPPRPRLHSLPSSSSLHAMQAPPPPHDAARAAPTPTVDVNVNLHWHAREYPQYVSHAHAAQDYMPHASPTAALDERMQHSQFYSSGGAPSHPPPPPPSAPYAWPVDTYDEQQRRQYEMQQQQQQQPYTDGAAAIYQHHLPQHPQAAYQGQGHTAAELARLGLAARDSRLDERWTTFMEDSGLLEGTDFRGAR
ncbi:fungal-specific transcription factor domain-containing protein [Mycena pura]|uniref:Fungal-specific transcription factor domain-containing protein n=1 Tax=Mycena pura TaxID=153505 RepID=A0AAD6VRR3_9AGAR|nr:fungal-specific transcription factor domain-containing protein [Mycena pura]